MAGGICGSVLSSCFLAHPVHYPGRISLTASVRRSTGDTTLAGLLDTSSDALPEAIPFPVGVFEVLRDAVMSEEIV